MKFKIGDMVSTRKGIGKIVSITDAGGDCFLVFLGSSFSGHCGFGRHLQDNNNNYWFFDREVSPLKEDPIVFTPKGVK